MYKKSPVRKKNKAYQKGLRFEYRVKKYYEKMGYYVKRSYASKGAEDLLAIRKNYFNGYPEVLHIQCKNYKIENTKLPKIEVANLKTLAKITGGIPIYVYNNSKHHLEVKRIE